MGKSKFFDKIKVSTIERQVEDCYNEGISFYFKEMNGDPIKFTYPYACDGIIETKTKEGKFIKLLMEYKFNMDFTNRVARARVIVQALFYMKRFEIDGLKLPNVILIGDINECFVFHSNDIIKYLDKDVNWKTAASGAADKNPDLVLEIANDENLNPFIFVIDDNFSFKNVADKIMELADNIQRFVHVTEHNISNIFDYFTSRVVKNVKKISANDIVAIFIGIISNSDNYYVHPKKNNIIITPFGDVHIDAAQYKGFIGYFNRKYTPQEKMKFAEISDRLIEDTNRRNKGEFYTPTLFVDYAHKMISEALGDDWKDEYVVWDNCCGTKNLTRDYRFKELYCSTLENAELDISSKYNPEAISFQFDFLNDPLDKLPKGLLQAFEQNKKIVFLLNPPYSSAGGFDGSGKGHNNNYINSELKKTKIGKASQELYLQFLYRIYLITREYKLQNVHIALFCNPSFICQDNFKEFRKLFLEVFKYDNGVLFNAGNFGGVSSNWGITFNIWSTNIKNDCKYEFKHSIIDNINGDISIIKDKYLYNSDNKTKHIKEFVGQKSLIKKTEVPNMKSPTRVFEQGKSYGTKDMIGCIYQGMCNEGFSTFLYNKGGGHKYIITPNNIFNLCEFWTVANIRPLDWENAKDIILYPVKDNNEFKYSSLILTIFGGYDVSLKNIKYHDKLWDIKNEFFWMSKSEIEDLANQFNNDDCYLDVHTDSDRFVYKKLQEITLTSEAQAVLDKASEIARKTFKYRELFNSEHPEYQINNWDSGWYQIKALAKEYAKEDLNEFKELYNTLANKMRPMIYELGFLKQ